MLYIARMSAKRGSNSELHITASEKCQGAAKGNEQPAAGPVDPQRTPVAQQLHRLCTKSSIGCHHGYVDADEDNSEHGVLRQKRFVWFKEMRQERSEEQVALRVCDGDQEAFAKQVQPVPRLA
jgi:hypothetical protein